MNRILLALLALSLVAGCTTSQSKGSGEDVLRSDVEDPDDGGEPDPNPTPEDVAGIPELLSQNLTGFAFSADGSTVTVTLRGIDTTPIEATYARNPAFDTAGYVAFSVQEDALDRLFIALGNRSADNSVAAGIVADGGQFNRVLPGGFYSRNGAYDPPDIGTGPGAGQVSYAGGYAGITNATTTQGADLLPVPAGIPESIRPGQPATVRGTIFLNANFADNQVNGGIYDRVLISPIDGSDAEQLEDLSLLITDIDENGEFFGDIEFDGVLNQDIGDYGGIFGGENASYVAGVVSLTNFTESRENDTEVGVFVLTQCGQPGDSAICDIVEPD